MADDSEKRTVGNGQPSIGWSVAKTGKEVAFEDLQTGKTYPLEPSTKCLFIEKTDTGYDFCLYEHGQDSSRTYSVSADRPEKMESLKSALIGKTIFEPSTVFVPKGKSAEQANLSPEFLDAYLHGKARSSDTAFAAIEAQLAKDPEFGTARKNYEKFNHATAPTSNSSRPPASLAALGAVGAGLVFMGGAGEKKMDASGHEKRKWGFKNVLAVGLGAATIITATLAAKRGTEVAGVLNKIKGWGQGNSRGV